MSPQRPLYHVRASRQRHPRTDPPRRQSTNRYTNTLEAAPVRIQDAPRRPSGSGIRQDGSQLYGIVRHTATHRKIVWHACKSSSPWPIKGRGDPPAVRGTGRRIANTRTLSVFSTILALASIKPLGPGGHASSPATLVATPLRAPRCKQYSAPSTPLLDVRPRPEPG
jgi:hypothetical protein